MALMETERLILRRFTSDDRQFILELLNSPSWMQFIGDRQVKTIEDAETYIVEKLVDGYNRFGFGFYMVELKTNNTPLGMCGVVKRDGLNDVDIGYAFLPEHEGNGYAFEAASSVMLHAVNDLGLQRIVAITTLDNARSIKLLHKIGFHFERLIILPNADKELMLFVRLIGVSSNA